MKDSLAAATLKAKNTKMCKEFFEKCLHCQVKKDELHTKQLGTSVILKKLTS
jgi:hypothetical protein